MPEETPPPAPPTPSASLAATVPATDFDIAEEFGTAKKNLPPVKILAIALAAVAIIAAIFALTERSTSAATGAITDVASVEVPNQNLVMVAVNVAITNRGEKPYWIHTMEATLETATGNFTDQAASAVDVDRYLQAFPELKKHALPPLALETKIEPGGQATGTILVTFPVTPEVFSGRKSLTVKIQPYDQPVPLVLTK